MNLKRLVLAIMTAVSLLSVVFALSQSLSEPQVQAQLELYQTNLILNAAQIEESGVNTPDSQDSTIAGIAPNIIGEKPYTVAENQYKKTIELTENSLQDLESQETQVANASGETPRQLLKKSIRQNENLLDDLNTKLGVIYAYQNKLDLAQTTWQKVSDEDGALSRTVNYLWLNQDDNSQTIDDRNLLTNIDFFFDGWFKNVNLAKFYELNDNQEQLNQILQQEQQLAEKAIYRLLTLSIIPIVGGLLGSGLVIFLLVQWLLKKDEAILATNGNQTWEAPWDGETIWQVLIVGFFFLSQVFLPILFGATGVNPAGLGIRGKAIYVLISYFLMAGGGLTVLYFSLKPFVPFPEGWFKLTNKNWFFWAIGGYLSAVPIVFIISFVNQMFWEGKGGSNPLLLLTLQSQDKFAIAILFITASIAAPIFEEIIFRGFLLSSLTRYMSVTGAIAVSALLFAIAHLSLAELIPLATLGAILGIVYTRSRSLLASILVHSLWNTGTLMTLFVLGSNL